MDEDCSMRAMKVTTNFGPMPSLPSMGKRHHYNSTGRSAPKEAISGYNPLPANLAHYPFHPRPSIA